MVIPDDGALSVLLHGRVVARKLSIHLGAETRELRLVPKVVGNALSLHIDENVDGGLEVAVALDHDAEDQVLEVAIRLLFLRCLSVMGASRRNNQMHAH